MSVGVGQESTPAIYGGDPPNANVATFGQLLDQLDAVLWSDGMFGMDEQRLFAAFMGKLKMKIQAIQQQQQQAAAQQQQFSPSGGAPPLSEAPLTMGARSGGGGQFQDYVP